VEAIMNSARAVFPSFRTVLAGLALTAISLGAQAQNVATSSLPVDPLGKQWWQLYNSIPLSVRARLGETPAACALGQRGNLWFLNTATDGSTPVTRRCTIPTHTRIFLPIITAFCVPFPGETIGDNIQLCRELIDPFDKLTLTIDGKNRPGLIERRAQSQAFPMWLPEDNIFDIPGENTPAGIYTTVTEGQYALIQSLPAGRHTIHARAVATKNPEIPAFEYTWILNVVKPTGVVPN
jgi:hypothetical protein